MAARGARAAKDADDRVAWLDCALDGEPAGRRAFGKASRARLDRGPNLSHCAPLAQIEVDFLDGAVVSGN